MRNFVKSVKCNRPRDIEFFANVGKCILNVAGAGIVDNYASFAIPFPVILQIGTVHESDIVDLVDLMEIV